MAEDNETKLTKAFDHILISNQTAEGQNPEITLGGKTFVFKPKLPVTAPIKLLQATSHYDGMVSYIKEAMTDDRMHGEFDSLLPDIDPEGLAELMEWLTETTTGFSSNTPPA